MTRRQLTMLTGRNELIVDDNDNKYLYFVNAENYRYAWNAII